MPDSGSLHDFTLDPHATVVQVIEFRSLPLGSNGSRAAVVQWSDGCISEALRWFDDEILVCEGHLIGKREAELKSLKFGRDRDDLQS